MYLTAAFIADSTSALARSSTAEGVTLSAPLIVTEAFAEGIALIDLPGQVEMIIDTLPSSSLPVLSGAMDSRLQSRLQPLLVLSLGLASVSLPAFLTATARPVSIASVAFALSLPSKMCLILDLLIST